MNKLLSKCSKIKSLSLRPPNTFKDKTIMGNKVWERKMGIILAFWGYSWQNIRKKDPHPLYVRAKISRTSLHSLPPNHHHTHRWGVPLSLQVKNYKCLIWSICLPASPPSVLGIPDFHWHPSLQNKNSSHVSCSAGWLSLKTVDPSPRVHRSNGKLSKASFHTWSMNSFWLSFLVVIKHQRSSLINSHRQQ